MDKDAMIDQIRLMFEQHGQYSQGLKALGIEGRRDSDFRYKLYDIDEHMNDSMEVLDIGCNCGFFSCLLANKVKYVTGFDKDHLLIGIALAAAQTLGLHNTCFVVRDFNEFEATKQYDFVIASQIHMWVDMPFDEYAKKIAGYVKPGGYLLFESHDTETVDKDIRHKVDMLFCQGLSVIHSGGWSEDPGMHWIPPKEHKKILRLFYFMKKCEETE